ncbi:MAG: SET domain-containing protein-lysine N-methyltransferase [Kiloniellaceae bacterium]
MASRPIAAGTIIERAPAVRLPAAERALVDDSALFAYLFVDPQTFGADSGTGAHDGLFAFGSLTFCNHAEHPNALVRWSSDAIGLWATLEAQRDIAPDEEITLYYTNISEYSGDSFII